MQKANSTNVYAIRRHRLIERQEIIHLQDPRCPVSIFSDEYLCWIASEEMVSLEGGGSAPTNNQFTQPQKHKTPG